MDPSRSWDQHGKSGEPEGHIWDDVSSWVSRLPERLSAAAHNTQHSSGIQTELDFSDLVEKAAARQARRSSRSLTVSSSSSLSSLTSICSSTASLSSLTSLSSHGDEDLKSPDPHSDVNWERPGSAALPPVILGKRRRNKNREKQNGRQKKRKRGRRCQKEARFREEKKIEAEGRAVGSTSTLVGKKLHPCGEVKWECLVYDLNAIKAKALKVVTWDGV